MRQLNTKYSHWKSKANDINNGTETMKERWILDTKRLRHLQFKILLRMKKKSASQKDINPKKKNYALRLGSEVY